MAPALLFALALLAADPADAAPPAEAAPAVAEAPAPEAPAEAAPAETPAPAPAPAADPLADAPWPTGAPSDDYGLVAWCYGALTSHMKLHDAVMPEVERIEMQWAKTPGDVSEEMKSYDEQQVEGVRAIAQFRRAMEAAEKASIKPIQEEGAAAIKKGASIWSGAGKADKRRLAQEWMSWGLPSRCVPTAESLEQKASLFGQALQYNFKEAPPPVETPAPAEEPAPPAEEPAAPAELTGVEAPVETAAPTEEPTLRGAQ